ncbi:predicted protein [Streptomyces sviceus ATCC 29083]|uniref:Uncharacterized protein n=1 Tax=Streptomyces sviceus (strain ATCC 29083 / DSM 924 / JCM 4929 / NBRC 13980 / NCIMB 11184 / NRRL 5439 / UC 5370) TaxID=463191 RepID=D6XBR6_STRX2|nr:predicted protein [Streptomyces sviceus ATCC 29083]
MAHLVGGLHAGRLLAVHGAEGAAVGQPQPQDDAVALGGQQSRPGQRGRSAADQFVEPGEVGAAATILLGQGAGQSRVQIGVEDRLVPAVRVLSAHPVQPPAGRVEIGVVGQRPAYGHGQQHAFAELAPPQLRHGGGAAPGAGDGVEGGSGDGVDGEGVGRQGGHGGFAPHGSGRPRGAGVIAVPAARPCAGP